MLPVPLFWWLGLTSACSWISPEWCRCSSDSSPPWRSNSWKAEGWEQETVCDLRNNQLNSPGSCFLWERHQPWQQLVGRDPCCALGEKGCRNPGFVAELTGSTLNTWRPLPTAHNELRSVIRRSWANPLLLMWKHTWLLSCSHCIRQQLSREKAVWGWCYRLYLCWRRSQHSWVHPTEFWFLTNSLNLQAMIFLLHGMNINFLNFQVGSNQTDTTFYQRVCSKIPPKITYFRMEPPFELEHRRSEEHL